MEKVHMTATTITTSLRRSSTASSLGFTTSIPSSRSSISSKSPGSSPRSPLQLGCPEPPELSLSNDDPSLDLDFDLLFLHDETSSHRPKLHRAKSSFTENWDNPSRTKSRPTLPDRKRSAGRRDWGNFSFSHYASATGSRGAVGLREKGRVVELHTKNKAEMTR